MYDNESFGSVFFVKTVYVNIFHVTSEYVSPSQIIDYTLSW